MAPCEEFQHLWWNWHPPLGVFIAFLALVGVLVPWFRGDTSRREKAFWTIVMLLFMYLEIRTLYLDRDEHDREQAHVQCEELDRFSKIAAGLSSSIDASKSQYSDTINHVDGVSNTTQGIADIARENLQYLSGGKSFAYVAIPPYVLQGAAFTVNLVNDGPNPLTGLSVTIARYLGGCDDQKPGDQCTSQYDTGVMQAIPMDTLGPYLWKIIPNYVIQPTFSGGKEIAQYDIHIYAQTGIIEETLEFRRASGGSGFEYRYRVSRQRNPKAKPKDIFNPKMALVLLKKSDWIGYVAPRATIPRSLTPAP
jgi:hypothetical protein